MIDKMNSIKTCSTELQCPKCRHEEFLDSIDLKSFWESTKIEFSKETKIFVLNDDKQKRFINK